MIKESFYDWCIKNNRQDLLDRWDYELNTVSPQQIGSYDGRKFYFKCPEHKHQSSLHKIGSIKNSKCIPKVACLYCNSFAQWGIDNICDDFLDKYWDYKLNKDIDPWGLPKASNKTVWIKCQKRDYHGSYSILVCDFYKGIRCPYCHMIKIHKLDSLGTVYPKSVEVWSDKNEISPYEVAPMSNKKMWFKCDSGKHEDYLSFVYHVVERNFECAQCRIEYESSFLQKKVNQYLDLLGYTYYNENKCSIIATNPETNRKLPYDTEVIINNNNLIIEVMGGQHYYICSWHVNIAKRRGTTPEEELLRIQYRDNIKKQYALLQGYHYLIIPYWTEDDESYKKLIDDKIKSIINTQQND